MIPRVVHLPLKSLDKCAVCAKTSSLRLCSSCGEQIYCSPDCQKTDWPNHKTTCGKTDRIDLAMFYPFLACLLEGSHLHPQKPLHPALLHTIVNSPNPGTPSTVFPDGSAAKLVLLGEPIPQTEVASEKWWPSALSDKVRSKLFRRICREGYLLPNLFALCMALLTEMYTTTFVPSSSSSSSSSTTTTPTQRRTRLQFHSSPISDFGIAKGRADVKPQDQLAYLTLLSSAPSTFETGQDPNDHYWLYFITTRGEELILDCGMFTFNLCLMVHTDPYYRVYRSLHGADFPTPYAPAYFRDREQAKNAPSVQYVQERFSFLRHEPLHRVVASVHKDQAFLKPDVDVLLQYMQRIAGRRKCRPLERDLVMQWTMHNCHAMELAIKERAWLGWPKEPFMAIEQDPGELDGYDEMENDEAWFKYMKKWNRKYNKGEVSLQELGDAFRAWEKKHLKKGNAK